MFGPRVPGEVRVGTDLRKTGGRGVEWWRPIVNYRP